MQKASPVQQHEMQVSVIVSTYRSGAELDGLISSLDAQTLPRDEWEIIVVDDGSPDATLARLHRFAASRENLSVTQIEHSGWPSRPRNTGLDLARGEYVVFVDHDDQLYPDALRSATAYAREHRADILNGKEARTYDIGWGLDAYDADVPQELGRTRGRGAVLPLGAHKLFRLAFLREHGIRFRDSGSLQWEDEFFTIDALRHASVVSTLASVPFYYWHTTRQGVSRGFHRSSPVWWDRLAEMVERLAELPQGRLGAERAALLHEMYAGRLLAVFDATFATRDIGERRLILERARRIQAGFFPAEADAHLPIGLRLRADLLRRGEFDALTDLTVADVTPAGAPRISGVRWKDGRIELDYAVRWNATPLPVRHTEAGFTAALPDDIAELFDPAQLVHAADRDAAVTTPTLRSRASRVSWAAKKNTVSLTPHVDDEGAVTLTAVGRAIFKPSVAAAGAELPREVWELGVGAAFGGTSEHTIARAIVTPGLRVDEHGVAAIYSNHSRAVVIDHDQRARPVTAVVAPTGFVRAGEHGPAIELPLAEVTADGVFDTRVLVNLEPAWRTYSRAPLTARRRRRGDEEGGRGWRSVPALFRVVDGRGWVEVPAAREHGSFLIRLGELDPRAAVAYRVTGSGARPLRGGLATLIG